MRHIIFGALIACMALASCKKNKNSIQLNGTYKGIFHRNINKDTAQVLLTFTGNKFTGISSKLSYPAICNGTYAIDRGVAAFDNSCAWPANFDWTLILKNEYVVEIKGDSLYIQRSSGDFVLIVDKYELVKQL